MSLTYVAIILPMRSDTQCNRVHNGYSGGTEKIENKSFWLNIVDRYVKKITIHQIEMTLYNNDEEDQCNRMPCLVYAMREAATSVC